LRIRIKKAIRWDFCHARIRGEKAYPRHGFFFVRPGDIVNLYNIKIAQLLIREGWAERVQKKEIRRGEAVKRKKTAEANSS